MSPFGRPSPGIALAAAVLGVGFPCAVVAAEDAAGQGAAELIREIAERPATLGAPLAISHLEFKTQAATFEFDEGLLFPAAPVGGQTVEMVFVGQGTIRLEPTDPVEVDHLELHTGQRRLSCPFTEAVFVITTPALRELLLGSPFVAASTGASGAAADARYRNWLSSGERRLLGVDAGLFRSAIGEPESDGFFAAWLGGTDWDDIWYSEDPDNEEPIALGRFRRPDPESDIRRKIDKELSRQQRRGRLQGLTAQEIGHLEEWVSTTPGGAGPPQDVGDGAFEPERYVIDVTIDSGAKQLTASAELILRARQEGRRSVRLRLGIDYKVDSIEDGTGAPLPWLQARGTIMALLPQPSRLGAETRLRVRYSGAPFERHQRGTYSMRETVAWHPHAGQIDRATYDVTIRWPSSLTLAASGTRVDGGRGQGELWERRRLDFPTQAFGFELGSFELRQTQAGHIRVNMAYGRGADSSLNDRPEKMEAEVVGILAYYELTFGRLPLDEITIATLPRDYAEGKFGFITVGNSMIEDREDWEDDWGLRDRETYLAHELAHQWWGHLVGGRSYRDHWLSEALAEYSALLYSRYRAKGDHRYRAGPIAGWNLELLRVVGGRTLESFGPVVLGRRLDSVPGVDAYRVIVYTKGALIMNMLAKRFMGDAAFPRMLAHVVTAARNKPISTVEFLSALERMSGADLNGFARQFIYGTGLPTVVYDWTVTPGDSEASTEGKARLFPPPGYRVVIEPAAAGGLDVRRHRDQVDLRDGMGLIVPFRLDTARGHVEGRLPLRGASTPFRLASAAPPTQFRLDPQGEILAWTISMSVRPKIARMRLGVLLRWTGEDDQAEAMLLEARRERDIGEDDTDSKSSQRDRFTRGRYRPPKDYYAALRVMDLEILEHLARLYLDQGRLEEARGALREMETLMLTPDILTQPSTLESSIWELDGGGKVNPFTAELQARLDLLEGRSTEVLKIFRKAVESWNRFATLENYALLAIAAHQAGDIEVFEKYREMARIRGVDTTALSAAPAGPAKSATTPSPGAP